MATVVKQVAITLTAGVKTAQLPEGSKVVNFQMIGTTPTVTAVGNPAMSNIARNFQLIQNNTNTNTDLTSCIYIGTVNSGGVWHLFEI